MFHGRLKGWKAIVTGAGTLGEGVGTGKAIAALFAAEGATVAILDLDAERAGATLALVREMGGEGLVVTGDLSDPAACERTRLRCNWARCSTGMCRVANAPKPVDTP